MRRARDRHDDTAAPDPSRRRFLASSVGAGLGVGAAVALGDGLLPRAAGASSEGVPAPQHLPFAGAHQVGIVTRPPQSGLLAAFDVAQGGGFYFALPGARGRDGFLGQGLVA